jgi:drug/metabolite transporter (DMT)-like permease
MINEFLVLASEVVLSAYPLLIKLVDASVVFQVGLRMLSFSILAVAAALLTNSPIGLGTLMTKETLLIGLLNLVHVGGSYVGFDQLAGGNAMALFYTYPVMNILGAAAVFGEEVPMKSLPWIGLALAGAVALSQPTAGNWTAIGVAAALLAALTETGIYLWFKSHKDGESDQPWTKMAQMYGSSGALWLLGVVVAVAVGLLGTGVFKLGAGALPRILLFNGIVGFLGYALRFYMIPKVSTVVFSALSFFGVIAAYLFSWAFAGEVPTALQAAGAAAIIVANSVLVTKETA